MRGVRGLCNGHEWQSGTDDKAAAEWNAHAKRAGEAIGWRTKVCLGQCRARLCGRWRSCVDRMRQPAAHTHIGRVVKCRAPFAQHHMRTTQGKGAERAAEAVGSSRPRVRGGSAPSQKASSGTPELTHAAPTSLSPADGGRDGLNEASPTFLLSAGESFKLISEQSEMAMSAAAS